MQVIVNPLDGIVRAGRASPCWKYDFAGRAMAFLADAQVAAEICRVGLDGDIRQKGGRSAPLCDRFYLIDQIPKWGRPEWRRLGADTRSQGDMLTKGNSHARSPSWIGAAGYEAPPAAANSPK